MKELLNRYQARLTRREDERVWGGIEGALRGDRVTKRRSRFFRLPSAGLAVAAAAVAITLVVKQGGSPPPIPAPDVVMMQKRAEDRLAQGDFVELGEAHEGTKAPGTEGEAVLGETETAPAASAAAPREADDFTRVKSEGDEAEAGRESAAHGAGERKDVSPPEASTVDEVLRDIAADAKEQAAAATAAEIVTPRIVLRSTQVTHGVSSGDVPSGLSPGEEQAQRLRGLGYLDSESSVARPIAPAGKIAPAAEPTPTQEKAWGNTREKYLSANEPAPSDPTVSRRSRDYGFSSAPPDAMFFRHYGINPEVWTEDDRRATIALDVDPASYGIVREYLLRRQLPPAAAVRVEEFVNAFPHGYAPPRGDDIAGAGVSHRHEGTFAFHLDAAPAPFGEGRVLFRVGLKGREIDAIDRKPVTLTFVIDTSGSMARENRLELVKDMLVTLVGQLRHDDEVAIVTYGSSARIVAPVTSVSNRWALEQQIRALHTNGSTNAEAGLTLGYQLASRAYREGRISRVILCSDGVANVGRTGPDAILDVIAEEAERGIDLTAIGVGMGNYNDVLLERLANAGDGQYYYVNDRLEAHRVFVENLTGTLVTIARDAKAQVLFNTDVVTRYRLLGYENRDVADEDFRNDAVDAGEVGAGHEVTVLFELVLAEDPPKNEWFARASVRFQDPETGEVTEDYREAFVRDIARRFDRMEATFRLDAAVAEFAEILRDSYYARSGDLAAVRDLVRVVAADVPQRDDVQELEGLVARAERLRSSGPRVDWLEREAAWERGERP